MASGEFHFKTRHANLTAFIDVFLFSKDGETIREARVKYGEEVLVMSSDMFFALLGGYAHSIYEEAATKWQNERLSS